MKSDEIIIFSVETLFNSFQVLSVVIHQVPFRLGNRTLSEIQPCRMLQQTKKLRLPKKKLAGVAMFSQDSYVGPLLQSASICEVGKRVE